MSENSNSSGWIDSWQLRDKKDVHPSHALAVVSIKWLEEYCKENHVLIEYSNGGIHALIETNKLLSTVKKGSMKN